MLSWDSELECPAKNRTSSSSHGSHCHSPGWGWGRSAGSVWAPYLPKNNVGGGGYMHSDFGEHISMALCPKPPSVQC